jgi:dienelactone hydrolase
MAPSSWLTTIFIKPFYVLRAALWIVPWFIKCSPSKAKPIVFDFFRALRADPETANMKIGAAGFCWGGKFTVQLCQDEPSSRVHRAGSEPGHLQSLIDVGFTAHPSFLKFPSDIEAVTKPLCIMVGDNDIQTSLAQAESSKEILEKKNAGDHKVIIIPGAKHGFAVRGFLKDIEQFKMGISAEDEAVSWFGKWFSRSE